MANFINDGTALNAAKVDLIPIGSSDPTKFVAATDWNQLRQSLLDIQTYALTDHRIFDVADKTKYTLIEAYNGSPNGVIARKKGSLVLDYTTPAMYQNQDGAVAWTIVGGGGGYAGLWSAGSTPYAAGKVVRRGDYTFGCETQNSIDPCFDGGDVTDGTLWNWNGFGPPNPALGWATLIANVNGLAKNMVGKNSYAGWDKRRICTEFNINGSADAMGFGIYDASLTQTPTGSLGSFAGGWGVELDMFNSRIISYVNGVANGFPVAVNAIVNDNRTNNHNFSKWYLDLQDAGATLTLTVWKKPNAGRPGSAGTSPMNDIADDLQFCAQWTGLAKPSFTNWRPIITARTGGANGTFEVKKFQALYFGTEWAVIGRNPFSSVQKQP